MNRGLVFSVEEFSTYDGPGIRTTVFLKGCPLRCSWCHNPEGQSFANEILKAQCGCIGCGACVRAGQEETGKPILTGKSIDVCPNRLLRWCAREETPESLAHRLEGYFDVLSLSGGGITFSGGEPLAHPAFLEECLDLLRGRIHTAVQTSGFCDADSFGRILERTDYMLFDIKLAEDSLHQRYTGVSNRKILQNFQTLCQSGKPFVIRTPLIPGVTDTRENLEGIARLLREQSIDYMELLPYHITAGGKYAALGRQYQPDFDPNVPVAVRKEIFERYGITAVVL